METHEQEDSGAIYQAIAHAELVTYIEDTQAENEIVPVFKLKDLVRMYSTRVEQLGTSLNGRVNSTHLKKTGFWHSAHTCRLIRMVGISFLYSTKQL